VHAVLTKADLEQSQTAYGNLATSAKAYRQALATLSTAASTFGSALEACARLKEARAEAIGPANMPTNLSHSFNAKGSCTADTLLAAAGLQHLVANHQQILSDTVYRSFEVPLLHELDKWRAAVDDEEEGYATAVKAQSREIRRLEKEGLKLHRQRRRDVSKFREHLVELTTKLDGLTTIHGEHARTLLRESQDTSLKILDASCSLVRAEVDIYESLARKGWTGGGLEDVLERGVDLFANDDGDSHGDSHGDSGAGSSGNGEGGSKLFSILPHKSILADTASDITARPVHTRTSSMLVDDDRYQSLASVMVPDAVARGRDSDSVFSEFNRSRGVRPFSPPPQPVRLNPDGLIVDEPEADEPLSKSKSSLAKDEIEEEEDDEAHHPWRNEGLSKPKDQDDSTTSEDSSSRHERRWSAEDDAE
jgi:hypothetical protein